MKKLISVALALVMVLSLSVAAFAADTCIVAGVAALCGTDWNASDSNNAMTLNGEVYEKVYSNVAAGDYQFKVVHNGNWKGNGDANVMFTVSAPCDVTITYNPADGTITYTGANVGKTAFKVNAVYAVGASVAAAPTWLNSKNWEPAAEANKATEVADGIYAIIFANVPAGNYEFKFAADGGWDHSWGGAFTEFNTDADISYNGSNIKFELTEEQDVTLLLNLSDFSLDNGGAKYNITLSAPGTAVLPTPGDDNTDVPGGDDNTDVPGDDGNTDVPGDDGNTDVPGDDGNTDVPGDNGNTDVSGDDNNDSSVASQDYYLVGYINGADYGIAGDSANLGEYKFVNGKLTVTFTADSYVVVKNGDNSMFMTEAYCEDTTATLVASGSEKMKAPGNTELTFTLTANSDGTLSLSYTVGAASGDNGASGDNNDASDDNTSGGNTSGDNNNTSGSDNTSGDNTQTPAVDLPLDNDDAVLTLFAQVPASWTTVNAYTWDSSDAPQSGEWPGTAMTKDGDWYKIVINDQVANVIINNGSAQTADLAVESGKDIYVIVADDNTATVMYADGTVAGGSSDNMGTGEPADENITGTESNFRVVGNADWMGNWDPASDAGRMLEVSPGVYKQNFENVQPGNYELKITQNGTWDKSWGDNGNNFCFTVVQACTITVTFTLDGENGTISVKGVGISDPGTDDISMISIVALMGLAVCAAGILIINKKKFI